MVGMDRAAIPAEPRGRGWRDAGADVAGLAGESGGWSAETRRDGECFVVGDEMIDGQHVTARHGFGEHVAFAGSARAAAGYSTGGVCRRASGCGAAARWNGKGFAKRGDCGFAASEHFGAEEADIYAAVGRVAPRPAAATVGDEPCRTCAWFAAASSRRRRTAGVERLSCGQRFSRAAVVDLRAG